MKILESERLIVRNFKPDDWRDLQEYVSQKRIFEFESEWDCTDAGCRESTEYFSKGETFWAVALKDNGKMIGHIYFNKTKPEHFMTWEIGYIFNPEYYGNGYATEACNLILKYAFEELNAHRVLAKCCPDNIKSWKLLERLSMRREGLCKKAYSIKKNANGEPIWWDELIYAILDEEWSVLNHKKQKNIN